MTKTTIPVSLLRRARWVLAPLLAFIALAAWGLASPVGAGPDDDYHLISVWCAGGGSEYCHIGDNGDSRVVASGFHDAFCYTQVPETSASCLDLVWPNFDTKSVETTRGNFYGEYPPVFYGAMRVFAGHNVELSVVVMRLVNAALFVGIATALATFLPVARRRTLLWGWLVTLVPLGMFLIPSNNPSGWAITGVGTAFLALLGWFETIGRRRWALGALYLLGVVMAAGSRGDAAVYAVGATLTVLILTMVRRKDWWIKATLPAVGLVIAVVLLSMAAQAGVGATGFSGGADSPTGNGPDGAAENFTGTGLVAYNVLMLPFLWTGVFGSWGLGWLDTTLPAIVPWAATGAFIAVAFAGLGHLNWRKAIAAGGVLSVLVMIPVYVLSAGGDKVGQNLQPRYLLPLIVLFAFLLVAEPAGRVITFGRAQTTAILAALFIANLVALQINTRRYVTGDDQQGLNLDRGAEWWWTGLAVGPLAVWAIGVAAYGVLLMSLWPYLRDTRPVGDPVAMVTK